jgi:hypothetical protein
MPGQISSDRSSTESEARRNSPPHRIHLLFDRSSRFAVFAVLTAGFIWRLWLAHATFFNTDEAWHFALANQASAWFAYKSSLTISHPPLLILILHFWRALGTSNLVLRLPSVIAGVIFCWIFFLWLDLVAGRAAAWAGLIFATFLGPMISTSAEVRQNPLLLMFSIGALYFFDIAFEKNSVLVMCTSSACLYFAMLSHYAAFFVAGALGIYSIIRMAEQRRSVAVMAGWTAGQIGGVALAGFLYKTHLGRLNQLLTQSLLPQEYLSASYFHSRSDHLLPFLYRGTFGVFRFVFGQTQFGQIAAIMFVAGVALLLLWKGSTPKCSSAFSLGILLLLPFVLNWIASAAGRYPYGRTRQCMFLAIVCLTGVSFCLSAICKQRIVPAAASAIAIVLFCHAFGTLQDRDAFPLAEQRHEHMDALMQFIRSHVHPGDLILTDEATSYQLRHYLCEQKPVSVETESNSSEQFQCEGFRVFSTGVAAGALSAGGVVKMHDEHPEPLATANKTWIIQGGWASGLGDALRSQAPDFANVEVHSFGRFLEMFAMPPISDHPFPRSLHISRP